MGLGHKIKNFSSNFRIFQLMSKYQRGEEIETFGNNNICGCDCCLLGSGNVGFKLFDAGYPVVSNCKYFLHIVCFSMFDTPSINVQYSWTICDWTHTRWFKRIFGFRFIAKKSKHSKFPTSRYSKINFLGACKNQLQWIDVTKGLLSLLLKSPYLLFN